jgi:hypothetical protein
MQKSKVGFLPSHFRVLESLKSEEEERESDSSSENSEGSRKITFPSTYSLGAQ